MKIDKAKQHKIDPNLYVGISKTPLDQYHPEDIFMIVCRTFNVEKVDMMGECRDGKLCDARRQFFHLANKYLYPRYSLCEIGKLVNKDHATVIYHLRKIQSLMEGSPIFKRLIENSELQLVESKLCSYVK